MSIQQLREAIQSFIRPDTFPVGIKIVKSQSELPAKAKRPSQDLGYLITICQAVSFSRRYGWTIAMNGADLSCPIAQVAFGYEEQLPFYSEGHLACGMYTDSLEAGAKSEQDVPKLSREESGYYVSFPLERAPFDPDVVVIYGNSAQVMRLVAGMLYKRGGSIPSTFSSRADCADIAIKPLQTGEPQVIVPCYGDRLFAQTQDHEMAFSFHFRDAAELVEGLEGTNRGGIRYPIPTYLRYQAEFPPTYQKLASMFPGAVSEASAGEEQVSQGSKLVQTEGKE
ncbi:MULTISPECIES: DUF169 domain-containing protein [Brevibacillus]|jgi:uncharacterized protein (DUF169 family)|uniref:DUF169 domain-containing protein n=1 Tax=Brevibacillus TaxID=55080 RepID=UPI00057C17B8|nr:DUF169 domain-containing protein [Brevibacillus borstelensis]MBE5398416.1 DUF169 domain-containing protein [Brevibacillus borstelensis]MCM3621285.1 DUF169 domain-containing protein [Brevibacillus borstelensis]MED1881452.1 DUF169 domain-containing protein [Brevibacillus borstelensis]RNB66639.1 hypothetical protein EDM54_00225 [Brevibacillus borstelensis]GED52469.1 hypothetical protein BBO01nite_17100 [Brevibacillus borstelensis]